MLNSLVSAPRNSLNRFISHASLVGTLSTISLLFGWVPGLSKDLSTLVFDTAGSAQSADQIAKYAKAVLTIEPVRKSAFDKVKQIMGGKVSGEVCRQGNSPGAVKAICSSFFTRSAEIINDSGLSIGDFNRITRQVQTDQGLKTRIQQELVRQQK